MRFVLVKAVTLAASLLLFIGVAHAGRHIVVDFSEAALFLYEEGVIEPIARFPVIVPRKSEEPPKFPVRGQVVGVEKHPYWYPTRNTKEFFLEKRRIVLPDAVPPGSPLNAMGTMKIRVRFFDKIKPTARIHGTNEPELFKLPSSQRHRSSGCIRMLNEDAEALGRLIEAADESVRVVLQK